METIILTDNKRLSTDYYADKTLFAQKIDVNHILNTEVYQSHISRVRFWTIRTNIHNEENLVHQLCKNLVNRGSGPITFEFSITKVAIGQQLSYIDEKHLSPINQRYNRSSRGSAYCLPNSIQTVSYSKYMNVAKPPNHNKTTSSSEWLHNSEPIHEDQRKTHEKEATSTPKNKDNQVISLKPLFKKEFQVASLSQLSAVFMSKEGIFSQFGMSEEIVMKAKRMITTYVFRQNEIEIGLSVVSEGCKKYIEKAINIQISQAFNMHFNSRKQAYESTCLNQNFSSSSIPKSANKLSQQIPKQTYHKILLFLFTYYDPETDKTKVSSSNLSQPNGNKETSKSIQAIQEWKMKDEDINIAQKLSKEYVLIKQEVENQKVSFKNKLKIFEAIIGQSVNVDKLLNQEKQMENSPNNTTTKMAQNTQNSHNINAPQNSRISRKSELKSMLNSPQQMASSTNSQFKRLKESFEMIRNIDNIITEQNKKISTLKLYQKEIIKSKNQKLYKSAKALNQVKKEIKQIKDEIQQKKIQNQFKVQKLQQQKHGKKRNFIPTPEAQGLLHSNVQVFKQIIQNEKTTKNNEKLSVQDEPTKERNGKQKKQRLSCENSKHENGQKKSFYIRKQTASFYHFKDKSLMQKTLQHSSYMKKQEYRNEANPPVILKTLYKNQQEKQTKLMKKRRQQIENDRIQQSVKQQKNRKSYYEEQGEEMSNFKQKEVLIALYDYFIKNNQLINNANNELASCQSLRHPRMDTTLQNSLISSQVFKVKSQNIHTSFYNNRTPLNSSSSQSSFGKYCPNLMHTMRNKTVKESLHIQTPSIDLLKFPLLDDIVNPKKPLPPTESEQCSIISDMIHQGIEQGENDIDNLEQTLQKKRVTIQNLMAKK